MLTIVAVVGHPLLLAMRRVVRPIQVNQDPLRGAGLPALLEGDFDQGGRQRLDRVRSTPLSGSRPHASFSKGSVRSVSASF